MTNSMSRLLAALAFAGFSSIASNDASATEAVAGRYVPGLYAGPGAGIVPPVPGVYWGISNVYYHGKIDGEVPFGDNTIAFGLEGDQWVTALAAVYVPEIDLPGNWTYAVQAAVPIGWTKAEAAVGLLGADDEVSGLGDISIAPVVLGWHNDALNTFFSASLTVTAPTGEWEEGELAFVGLNYWTFTPAIGFTRLIPEHGLDLSAKFGVDINTENPDTDYYSGAMAHLDLAITKSVTENFSIGALAGFLYQFEDDDSAFADARDGFKGRSIAVGPFVKYKAKFSETSEADFALRWAHEVDVKNRMKGDAIFLDITGKF
ncbi:transporter [Mesorhizobium sp. WSM2561]|uniref:SphA family protein n=1 Tax=Mesorhizobium sp. WSM2561 TaxID=1040985 RepID=UPI0004B93FB3|nr:transporter [Mesorhizobium sp. WSM2561]